MSTAADDGERFPEAGSILKPEMVPDELLETYKNLLVGEIATNNGPLPVLNGDPDTAVSSPDPAVILYPEI